MYTGPNIIKDGLVFGYDTGYGIADNNTVTRFYPGEPATNNSILAGYTWWGDGGNQSFANKGATAITDNSLKYNGYDTVLWTPGSSQNCYLNGTADFNYSDGSTVWTFSCYVKREDGAAITSLNVYMYYPSSDGNAAGTIVDCGNGWYRVSRTRTGGTSAIQLAGFTGFSPGNKYYLSGVMLSKTGHTVPYVAVQSSRSSTASLIDLKETTDINVANVSFDSTGQPEFDGANDRISITDASKFYSNVWTWEFITKFNSNSGTYQGLVWGEGATGGGSGYQYLLAIYNFTYFHYRIYNTTTQWTNTNVDIDFTPTEYNHIVWQFDNGNTKIYTNGELLHTDTSRGAYSGGETSPLYIGSRNDLNYDFNGSLPVAKHYNRILTASEIKQNFNAYKNRFDI